MTDAKNRRAEREDKPESTRRAEWLGAVDAALRTLTDEALWYLIDNELRRRRYETNGAPARASQALYDAAGTTLSGVLGIVPTEQEERQLSPTNINERALLHRHAQVQRGAKLQTREQERVMQLYELRETVRVNDFARRMGGYKDPYTEALMLSKRFKRAVAPSDVAAALAKRSEASRVLELAIVVGIIEPCTDEPDWRRKLHYVKKSLRTIDTNE